MILVWVETHINAATIPGSVLVSLTRLAIWRVAILHLAGIIPAVKVLKHVKLSASWVLCSALGNARRILCNNLQL